MFNQKRRCLIVEESDVTTVLQAVNRHKGLFGSNDIIAGNCGWSKEPTKWYVRFYTSDKQWGRIAGELSTFGKIYVNVTPGGATDLHFARN